MAFPSLPAVREASSALYTLHTSHHNVSDDDTIPDSVEDVLSIGVAMEDQRHSPLCAGQGGKHALCREGGREGGDYAPHTACENMCICHATTALASNNDGWTIGHSLQPIGYARNDSIRKQTDLPGSPAHIHCTARIHLA